MAEFEILQAESADFLFPGVFHSVPGLSHASRAAPAARGRREGRIVFLASPAGGKPRGALQPRLRRALAENDRVPEGRKLPQCRYFRAEKSERRPDDRSAGFRAV